MKLHIGCGDKHFDGWINLDIQDGCDLVDDARTLEKIQDESCDIIYASHILEHTGRHEYMDTLRTWYKKLKIGGTLRVSVPDLAKSIMLYDGTNLKMFWGAFYGSQANDFQYHKIGFDKNTLSESLLEVGFEKIQEWDWRTTDHSHYDDFSQAYLPHMDKENGTQMSLNIEAIK